MNSDERDGPGRANAAGETWSLRLYVVGHNPNAERTVANLRALCEEQLAGRYELEVVDLDEFPELAEQDQIIAAPTLIRKLPPPVRKLIGDLTQTDKVLVGLDLKPRG